MSLLWGHSVCGSLDTLIYLRNFFNNTRAVGLSSPCCTHSPSSRGWWAGTLSTWTRGSYQSWCSHGLDSHPPAGRRTPTDNACNNIRKSKLAKVLLDIVHYLRYIWCVMYYFLGLSSISVFKWLVVIIIFSPVPFVKEKVYGCCLMVFPQPKNPIILMTKVRDHRLLAMDSCLKLLTNMDFWNKYRYEYELWETQSHVATFSPSALISLANNCSTIAIRQYSLSEPIRHTHTTSEKRGVQYAQFV